ncbi:dTMP kinase [Devriesea agamarum]|uniref:dTMP kinase n=1 Tax=Devriesea agamarum TaxID=472569 RepID=UPI0022B22006|nr:dTMP kinase [Devriesea agamarum]
MPDSLSISPLAPNSQGVSEPPSHLSHPRPCASASGLFVTFEGGDGAGKSTQIRMLADFLNSHTKAQKVLVTREPGGSDLGQGIRTLLLHSGHVATRAEALLYAADRAHHIAEVVRPHLDSGGIVLSDRYLDSSVAYQGAGRALDPADIRALSLWGTDGLLPHLTFLLDLDPDLFVQRRSADTHDRLEREDIVFHQAVRAHFLALAEAEPHRFVVLDANQSRTTIHQAIRTALSERGLFDCSSPETCTSDSSASESLASDSLPSEALASDSLASDSSALSSTQPCEGHASTYSAPSTSLPGTDR